MKTLRHCKDLIAQEAGYDDWIDLSISKIENMISHVEYDEYYDKAAEMYAMEKCEEQKVNCASVSVS